MKKYYQILDLPVGANKKRVREAFRQLAKKYHPDVNASADAKEKFLQIREAYDYLYYGKRARRLFSKPSQTYKPSPPQETAEERRRRYAKSRAARSAEQDKKEKEAFRKSHFYDIFLALHYLWRAGAIFMAFFLIILPIHSYIKGVPLYGYFHPFLLVVYFLIGCGLRYFTY